MVAPTVAPKIAVTKFQPAIPTRPQLMQPIATTISAIIFAIIILLLPINMVCNKKNIIIFYIKKLITVT